jgi:hypothetical protein
MRRVLVGLAAVAILLALGVYVAAQRFNREIPIEIPIGRACEVRTDSGVVTLAADQLANAATIAAVGITRQLPDQAVVIALATALQESELVNLSGGDRDSVGLFQQRPSQGWGSAENLADPRYASNAFYNSLERIRNWQDLRVTEAAQAVQRSAFPEAYDKWVDEAAVLGEALVGQASGAVSCTRTGDPAVRGDAAAVALRDGLAADWGNLGVTPTADPAGLAVAADDARMAWQYAHWLVAHSAVHGVERVSYADQAWDADTGKWIQVDANPDDAGRVVAVVYPG